MPSGPSRPEYLWSDQPDPHVRRRREIFTKYPQIRALFGFDRSTAVIIFAVVILQLSLAGWIAKSDSFIGSGLGFVLFSYLVGGILNHWLAMGMHECTHNLAARTPTANKWIAIIANFPIPLPGAMAFRRWHIDHHHFIGQRGKDNDLPIGPEIHWVGNSPWRKAVWLLLFLFISSASRGFLKPPNKWEWINIAVQSVVSLLIITILGWHAMAYLALSTFFGMGLHPTAAHWVHEHYLFDSKQETYSYYGPLNHVNFNVGYHFEHHDFMNIPGRLLPRLKAMAPEYYDSLVSHRSWTAVLWRFITDREMGNFSRIVRAS